MGVPEVVILPQCAWTFRERQILFLEHMQIETPSFLARRAKRKKKHEIPTSMKPNSRPDGKKQKIGYDVGPLN